MSQPARSLAELIDRLGAAGSALSEILDSLGEAVTIRNPEHGLVHANRRAVEHMHFDSLEELLRAGPASIMSDYLVHDEAGNPLSMEDVPSVRQVAGEAPR